MPNSKATQLVNKRILSAVAIGALLIGLAVLLLTRPQSAGSAGNSIVPAFGVLQTGSTLDAETAGRLPDFVKTDTARLAYADDSGSYVAAMSDKGEVCLAWLAAAGGNYTSCQDFSDGFDSNAPVVAALTGGYGAGPETRVVGLVPDFIDSVKYSDGQAPEIRSNVFSAPAKTLALEVAGAGQSWHLP